ncbi:piwi-like protein Siwi [Anoplolepis gracilipes]|uniref:piwi-like protein Siwi n=1 Tax=Anoplolepis gracilipes TaxID=354296 RepID=UPI003BA3AE8C
MSQRGRGGRGRAIHRTGSSQQEQQLPHAQPSSSSGAVRRPGQTSASTGGRGQKHIGEKGDATVGQIGRGLERMTIQPADGSGDAGAVGGAPVPVVSGRGATRGKRNLPLDIFTKPSSFKSKMGTSGQAIRLQTNYFKLIKSTDWAIHQYHVNFAPQEDRTFVRKALLKLHKNSIEPYIFDGSVMYTSKRLPDQMTFTSTRKSDEQHITINVRLVGDILVGDVHFLQFFNIIMRKCFEFLQLKLVGRNYFDPASKIILRDYNLELWPGYVTSIRQHERDILMCAEITNKVMRLDTLLDILNACFRDNPDRYIEDFSNTVIGTVVLTHYNNNTYRINDVDFKTTPLSTFALKDGTKTTYKEYYKTKYGLNIKNDKQPLLVTKSKTRSRQAEEADQVYLVPELCRATGLTDSMRENFRLMSSMATYTRLDPRARIEKLMNFNNRLLKTHDIVKELSEWNLELDNRLLNIPARQLFPEKLYFGGNNPTSTIITDKGDWSTQMRTKQCLVASQLRNWTFIISERDEHISKKFIELLIKVSKGISFYVDQPEIRTIRDDRPNTYSDTLERILSKSTPQLVFCVVSNNRSDRYSAIKKKCCVDRPVPSQVCTIKIMTHRNIMSIATKIAIQMNCKLGGAPWSVDIPMDGLMIIGFDVCHDTTVKSKAFGAIVATLDKRMTKYYSAVSAHSNGDELSNDLSQNICRAVQAYHKINGTLPSFFVIYRDGVGEGQVEEVKDRELKQIKESLTALYGVKKYKMAFIIVTKRLNTRFFFNNANPPSGTVVDDVITSPIKYDFFIVSQQIQQGTITPTSYSIIDDSLDIGADKMQRMSYKLTHMYFNCSNTVRVPAPCHYAHKLAFLVSRHIHRAPHSQLQNTLYFL